MYPVLPIYNISSVSRPTYIYNISGVSRPTHIYNISSVSRPAYMSLPSPNMPTAEDEDETDVNTEVSANITGISIKNFKQRVF